MKTIPKAICWAAALIVAAAASRYGVMDRGSETTLMIVLPLAVWMSLSGRGSCAFRREA